MDSKICLDCFGELKRGFEFRQQCRENDQRYQELIGLDGELIYLVKLKWNVAKENTFSCCVVLASPGVPSGLEMMIIKQEAPDGTFMEESKIFKIKEEKPETSDLVEALQEEQILDEIEIKQEIVLDPNE